MGYDGRGGKFDIIAVRGADLAFTVTATDSVSAAIDLSAATIAGELYASDGTVFDTMTDVVSGTDDNIITLSFTDAETALLTGSSYAWTLWVTRGGDKRPWLAGRVRVVDSSNGVKATDGDAVTLTVDSDVNVSVSVLAIGGTGGGASTLDDLTDVTITTPVLGNALVYNGSVWANAVPAGGGDMLKSENLSGLANTTTARSNLGVAIGTNVQAYSAVLAGTTASFTTADESKLDGIEAGADVTDTTNVTAAGALMDSEVDADIKTLSLPANTTISTFGATLVDDADQATARSTLGLGTAATTAATAYATAAQGATADGAIPKSLVDAKGDLLVATANDTPARLAVGGTNGHVLTVDSAEATGVKWAAAAGGSSYPTGSPVSTEYGLPGLSLVSASTYAPAADRVHYFPFVVASAITLQRAGVEISATTATAGSVGAIGIYNAGKTWRPTTLVADLGTVAIDSTGGKIISGLSTALPAGRYLLSYNSQSSVATYRTVRGAPSELATLNGSNPYINVIFAAQTYATPPATPTDWTTVSYDTLPLHHWIRLTWTVD